MARRGGGISYYDPTKNNATVANQKRFQNVFGVNPTKADYRTVSGGYGFGSPAGTTLVSGARTVATPNEVYINKTYNPSSPSSSPSSTTSSLPSTLSLTDTGSTGGSGGTGFVPTTFNGVVYNTPQELEAAKLAYYQQQHDDYAKALTDAYNSGLISFDERKTALEQNRQDLINSRNSGLGAVQASYAQASPDVIQSSQGDYQNRINDQFNTANAQIGTAGDTNTAQTAYGDIARNLDAYNTQYQNNIAANDLALQNQQDLTANDLANWTASQTAAGTSVPNTIDTTQLLSGLAGTYAGLVNQGFTTQEADTTLRNGLIKGGINASQVDPILSYFYNNFLPRYKASPAGQ